MTHRSAVEKQHHVFVKYQEPKKTSDHLVDLKESNRHQIWDGVNAYSAVGQVKNERAVVDLAAMVRQANAKQSKIEEASLTPFVSSGVSTSPIQKKSRHVRQLRSMQFPKVQIFSNFPVKRIAYAFVVLLLLVSIPFPAVAYYQKLQDDSREIVEESTNAFLSLQSSTVAAFQSNVSQAATDLNSALESFHRANSIIDEEHKALVYVASMLPVVGKQVSSRQHLLTAGHHMALGNTYVVRGMSQIEASGHLPLTERIEIFRAHVRSAIPQYKEALEDLEGVDPSVLPVEYQQSFQEFKLLFTALIDDMTNLADLMTAMETVFGSDDLKRYLIIFQNNHELRATGGFMGSFAVLDVQKGKIQNIEVPSGGTHDLRGQLDVYVEPPLPMQLMSNRWEFQDANWFPDFPASAEKVEWFYSHARGKTVDGVIAINATVLERLLGIMGPVQIAEFDLTLDSENALVDLQKKVELDYDKEENTPKAVIGVALTQLLEQLGDLEELQLVTLISELHAALQEKEIQVYMNDIKVQETLQEYGWTGEIKETAKGQDFLQVVNTNVHGQKSDAKISQDIEHQAVVQKDGSVIVTTLVRRTHSGIPGEEFYGVSNVDYLRMYVPEGSELLDAGGFEFPPDDLFQVPEPWYEEDKDLKKTEIEVGVHKKTGTRVTREFGKTAFGNWTVLPPGETVEVFFTYKLPFRAFDLQEMASQEGPGTLETLLATKQRQTARYSLLHQKQSGIESHFVSKVIFPDGWIPHWKTGDIVTLAQNGAFVQTDLTTDLVYGVVMEKEEIK
ncbi:MAG: DUF4012 domain-containing protein [Candidatus Magasanikbacteria bacterium]